MPIRPREAGSGTSDTAGGATVPTVPTKPELVAISPQTQREASMPLIRTPLNEDFAKAIGADAYCRDAAVAVETAKSFMARKHNQLG